MKNLTLVPWEDIASGEVIGRIITIVKKRADRIIEPWFYCTGVCTYVDMDDEDPACHIFLDAEDRNRSMDVAEYMYDNPEDFFMAYYENVTVEYSNKGKSKCVRCNCTTEKRRDFSDMSIREFCPRCKI